METIAFGWAAGDIIAVIRTIHDLLSLFRGARGAQDNFTINAAWLESFARDLQRVHDFISKSPNASCIPGLREKLLLISSGYTEFEQYLDGFDVFLPQAISVEGFSRKRWKVVKKVKKSVQWSWEELNHRLNDLKLAVSMPLAEMNLILLLDLCSDFQVMNQRVESLPTASDVSEIKTLIEAQIQNMKELAKTADEIGEAIRDSTKAFAMESTLKYEARAALSTVQARLSSIAGHIQEYTFGAHLLQSAIENQQAADRQCSGDVERLKSFFERYKNTSENINALLLSALQRLDKLEEETVIVKELKEGFMQNQREVEELKKHVSEGKSERDRESIRQVFQTGVSIAATATIIAVAFSGLLQKRWEMAINITTAPNLDPEIARFEAKWLSIRTSIAGTKSGCGDAKNDVREESQVGRSPRKLRDVRESTPAYEESARHENMEVAVNGSINVLIDGSNYHTDKE